MHNQPREPQPYEDCQAKSIQEFRWTSQGMDWGWGQLIYLIHKFHNLSWITEINELFHNILIYWDAPVYILHIWSVGYFRKENVKIKKRN